VAVELQVLPHEVTDPAYREKRPCLILVSRRYKTLSLRPFFADSAAEPVKPSWKNILMVALMARRPLTNQAFNSAVIRPMLFRSVKVKPVYSMRLQKATIWSQLSSGAFEKTTNLLGPSESSMPMDGNKWSSSFKYSHTK